MPRRRSGGPSNTEIDMTPMIDMTFQLIAFFMFVINFSDAEQDERVQLPSSQLAKPKEAAAVSPITVQLTKEGGVIYGGEVLGVADLAGYLEREKSVMSDAGKDPKAATVIVRADASARTGEVQDLIQICQKAGFERFALRARYQDTP
ncbi:MAG: ExbD/TolR family protein [Planctomycetaceae bacterium]